MLVSFFILFYSVYDILLLNSRIIEKQDKLVNRWKGILLVMDIVFHATSKESKDRDTVLAYASGILEDETIVLDDVVVVVNVDGVKFLLEGSKKEDKIKNLIDKGVVFKACNRSMESRNLKKQDLIQDIKIVPTAVGELTKLQNKGYSYIKIP